MVKVAVMLSNSVHCDISEIGKVIAICHAKIAPGENCTGRYNFRNQNCTARYNFGCEKCTGLAKSVPGSEKGPLAI